MRRPAGFRGRTRAAVAWRWTLAVALGVGGAARVARAEGRTQTTTPAPSAASPAAPLASSTAPPLPLSATAPLPAPTPDSTPTSLPAPEAEPASAAPPPLAATAPTPTPIVEPSSPSPTIPPPASVTWTPRLLVQSDAVVTHHGPGAPAIEDGTAYAGIYLRRARVGADAVSGIWRARMMIEAASQSETAGQSIVLGAPAAGGPLDPIAGPINGRAPRATEAFVALTPHKGFALTAGALRVPIGLSRQLDEADLRLPERARVIARATPDFRVGAAVGGDLGLLQYSFGTYAAAPTFGSDFATGGTLYVLRLSGEPVGPMGNAPHLRRRDDPWYGWWRFSAGLSGFIARLYGPDEYGLGGDGQFQWRRLCVTGEVLWTRRAGDDRVGFTVEPGVFLVPDRLELVARLEWLNDQVGPQSPTDAWGTSLGATFFSASRHARLQAAYTIRRPGAGDDRVSGWATVRATFTM